MTRVLAAMLMTLSPLGLSGPLSCVAQDSDAASRAELRRWIQQLGNGSFATRTAATTRLIEAGIDAVDPVAEAVAGDDRERRERAVYVLRTLAENPRSGPGRRARVKLSELAASPDLAVSAAAGKALRFFVQRVAEQLVRRGARLDWSGDDIRGVSFASKDIVDDDLLALRELKGLRVLDLRFTQVTNAALAHVRELSTLEVLNLQATRVTDDGLARLSSLTNLRSLSLERTGVTDAGLSHLKPLRQMSTLYLGGSKVTGPGFRHLADVPIDYVSFQHSEIDDSVVEHLRHLPKLKTLGLDDTPVTDACIPKLVDFKQVEVLWLDKSNVTDKSLEHLAELTHLKKLHLNGTKISREGLSDLKAKLKNVQVVGSVRR